MSTSLNNPSIGELRLFHGEIGADFHQHHRKIDAHEVACKIEEHKPQRDGSCNRSNGSFHSQFLFLLVLS